MSKWLILEKYPFTLLPGSGRAVEGGSKSYYQYMNERWQETGKNVLALEWLVRDLKTKNPVIEEPFGGCGVFAVALQNLLHPKRHYVMDLDAECAAQLQHCLSEYPGVEAIRGDARQLAGVKPADLCVYEIPFFTYSRLVNNEWRYELRMAASHNPEAIILTDGSACKYGLVAYTYAKMGLPVTKDPASYVSMMSKKCWDLFGYSITGVGWHGTCFYFRLQKVAPGDFEMKHFPAGCGYKGLRKIEE